MSHGNDDNILFHFDVDQQERKSSKGRLSEAPPSRLPDHGILPHSCDGALQIIWKILAETR